MKLVVDEVTTSSDGFTTSKKAYIAQENLGIIFDTLSKSFYSDPIGSIIREYSNNSIDAFVAAGKDPRPVIEFKKEDRSLHFIDEGTGLNPEQMESIFLSFGESTKRNTDDQIGSFGLGSKSAISYTPAFYITTRTDGVEYQYLFSKTGPIPELDLLQTFVTDKPNGTDVWFYLKPANSNYSYQETELELFVTAINRQLPYLENVEFRGLPNKNEFTLFKGDHFIYRPDLKIQNGLLHICFGHNVYPINFQELDRKPIEFDGALLFGIDSGLQVTPNREQIRYTSEVKELINNKIDLLQEELQIRYDLEERDSPSLLEFLKDRKRKAQLQIGDKTLELTSFGVKKNWFYKPLEGLSLVIPDSLETIFSCVHFKSPFKRGYVRLEKLLDHPDKFYLAASEPAAESRNKTLRDWNAEGILWPKQLKINPELINVFYPKKASYERKWDYVKQEYVETINNNGIDWQGEIEFFFELVREELQAVLPAYEEVPKYKPYRTYDYRGEGEVSVRWGGKSQEYLSLQRLSKSARYLILVEDKTTAELFSDMVRDSYGRDKSFYIGKKKLGKGGYRYTRALLKVITTTKQDVKKVKTLHNVQTLDWFFTQPMWPSILKKASLTALKKEYYRIKRTVGYIKPAWLDEVRRLIDSPEVINAEFFAARYGGVVPEHPLTASVREVASTFKQVEAFSQINNHSSFLQSMVAVIKLKHLYKQQAERCKSQK